MYSRKYEAIPFIDSQPTPRKTLSLSFFCPRLPLAFYLSPLSPSTIYLLPLLIFLYYYPLFYSTYTIGETITRYVYHKSNCQECSSLPHLHSPFHHPRPSIHILLSVFSSPLLFFTTPYIQCVHLYIYTLLVLRSVHPFTSSLTHFFFYCFVLYFNIMNYE